MNAWTNAQTIVGADGKPAFVVLPYQEFLNLYREQELIPHAVVQAAILSDATPVKAWREHLRLLQQEVALRLGISQPAYARQENSRKPRPRTLEKIAAALGLTPEQINF
ncbi:helix-turn-helix transcriptional regulator [Herbaspirillum sp. WKF16]|uniref:helix-turn-helix domain-containing protein n=1 Tax=Herbaspirillum sp. WKF16 TaxID=3028312 RepID=UPI0023A98936|nr:helix-turn-helix transcriptional regulator [Herbaspirillum sp. WKF16]WDZ98088.1 helix-turn-helix transcriptional regulator [Herbaspirillum sp. WKF16]